MKIKKNLFFSNIIISETEMILNLVYNKLLKFEEDCLKTVGDL